MTYQVVGEGDGVWAAHLRATAASALDSANELRAAGLRILILDQDTGQVVQDRTLLQRIDEQSRYFSAIRHGARTP